ncbi:MAG: S8 family serine peptidase [Dehalococcoidia bacterium]
MTCPGGRPVNPTYPPPPPDTPPAKAFKRFYPGDVGGELDRSREALNATGLLTTAARPQRRRVRVAIFDTWPVCSCASDACHLCSDPLSRIRDCRDRLRGAGRDTSRLDPFADGIVIPRERIYDSIGNSPLRHICSHRRDCDGDLEDEYAIADHGLFIAGLIHEICPAAQISVYRVLNDYGIGIWETIAKAVGHAINEANGAPLVLNLSLGFGPELVMLDTLLEDPVGRAYNAGITWAKDVAARIQEGRDPAVELNALGHPTFEAMTQLFNVTLPSNVFVVAAAGNDSCRATDGSGAVAAPRFPAAIDGVLAVAATAADGQPASYSNDDEISDPASPRPDNGVGAPGGSTQYVPVPAGSGTSASGFTRSENGIVGLYVSDNLPNPNLYGLAEWSGTSFAAPIAAALAACIWQDEPGLLAIDHEVPWRDRATNPPRDLLTAFVGPPRDRIELVQRL